MADNDARAQVDWLSAYPLSNRRNNAGPLLDHLIRLRLSLINRGILVSRPNRLALLTALFISTAARK